MTQARALTTMYHDGVLLRPGDLFDYPDDQAQLLKGVPGEGMELVTKKTTAAFEKAQSDAHDKLEETARVLVGHYEQMKAQLDADPTRGDLVQLVLDAEIAAREAQKAVDDSLASLI